MKTTQIEPHKSSLGMDANIAAVLIFAAMAAVSWFPYIGWLAWAVPIVFFILEKESKFVKFQAVTALIIGVVRAAIAIVLQIFVWILTPKDVYSVLNLALGRGWGLWTLLGAVSTIIGVGITVIIVYLIVMAYGYKQIDIPVIGQIASKLSEQLNNININTNANQSSQSSQSGQTKTEPEDSQNKDNNDSDV